MGYGVKKEFRQIKRKPQKRAKGSPWGAFWEGYSLYETAAGDRHLQHHLICARR